MTVENITMATPNPTSAGKPAIKIAPKMGAPRTPVAPVSEKRSFGKDLKVEVVEVSPVSNLEDQIKEMDSQLGQNLEAARQRMATACESFNDSCEAIQAKMKTVDDMSLGDIKASFAEAARLTDLANQVGEMIETASNAE
jgi:hypothetical protein